MVKQQKSNGNSEDPFDQLDYPCRFEIKALGKNNEKFLLAVMVVVTQHVPGDDFIETHEKPSKNSNYISITVSFVARGTKQIRDLYAALIKCPEVLMTL